MSNTSNSGFSKIHSFATPSAFDPTCNSKDISSSSTALIVSGTVRGQRNGTATGDVWPAENVPAQYPASAPGQPGTNSAYPLFYNYLTGEIFFYYNVDVLFPK